VKLMEMKRIMPSYLLSPINEQGLTYRQVTLDNLEPVRKALGKVIEEQPRFSPYLDELLALYDNLKLLSCKIFREIELENQNQLYDVWSGNYQPRASNNDAP